MSCACWLVSQHHPDNSMWLRGASVSYSTLDRGREEGRQAWGGKGFPVWDCGFGNIQGPTVIGSQTLYSGLQMLCVCAGNVTEANKRE